MKSLSPLVILASLLSMPACSDGRGESALWREFVEASERGGSATLPDYSYAGYDFMDSPIPAGPARVFKVEEFGAKADDGVSDRDAVQAALDAASKKGGVVLFQRGRYLLNTLDGEEAPLRLSQGNVVMRGAGSGEEGTHLVFERHLEPEFPDRMYSTPFMLHVEPTNTQERFLSKVVGKSERGSFELTVQDPSPFAAGDWITLRLRDPKAVPAFFGDRPIRPEWKRLVSDGIGVSERHQIVSVNGNTLRLRAPLQVTVDPQFGWSVQDYPAIEEVGIEQLRFVGGWKGDFVHHRSALDDGGWSGIRLHSVRNGWIRDVVMNDWNYGIRMDDCSAFSVLRLRLGGTLGHHAVHARGGYGVLFGLVADTAGHFHGPGVGYMSASTVFWRFEHTPKNSFDAHSTGPYATLLDSCRGGWRYGRSGGPLVGMPNHLRGLTLWNFERTGGEETEFDFWRQEYNKRDLFLDANIVGFHGKETRFNEANLGTLESLGQPVQPESLFEAQLSLRLGRVPAHLEKELELWQSASSEN
ncbi:DUF4955 domain-containing protein [Pelagicoccus sp. SDUM812005]|uniref:DUF4955 domain-containing protein n=1 Tax=Pelagicoccus sp. SDUM812005 TaxID=3041257 RepID=UPI00280DAE98|nr:DUF4955 domain-containing protein [Pelagicoccus sp. SDUM812005]MDQ8179943.1 DUF4955 domain-containing protein [Pelagicoccus sp. SDUM812005]